MIDLSGTISAVRFSGDSFTVGTLTVEATDGKGSAGLGFAGPVVVAVGDSVVLSGAWENHPKYGFQFAAKAARHVLPSTAAGLARYLAGNPAMKGIGPAKARRLAEAFPSGQELQHALVHDPASVARVAGLSAEAVTALRGAWEENEATNELRTWLAAYGLTHNQIEKVAATLGWGALTILRDDPYRLVGLVEGLGFGRVDAIARRNGVEKNHPGRIAAAIMHVVKEAVGEGHTWIPYKEVALEANLLLRLDEVNSVQTIMYHIEGLLDALREGGQRLVAIDPNPGGPKDSDGRWEGLALPWLAKMENEIGEWLKGNNE